MDGLSLEPVINRDGDEEQQSSLTRYLCMPTLARGVLRRKIQSVSWYAWFDG